jgi:hypothetical protein
MCETIDPESYIRWVLGFGIKTGYDRLKQIHHRTSHHHSTMKARLYKPISYLALEATWNSLRCSISKIRLFLSFQMFKQQYRSMAIERFAWPAPILATVEESQATVPWALEEGLGLPGSLNHDQIRHKTSKENGCVAFSGSALQRGQQWLFWIPLISKMSAVRIFWCIAVQPKKFTFGLALAFQILPVSNGGWEPWNWME